jgi:Fe-S-cluster containining protein
MEDKDKKYGEDIYKLNLYKYRLEDLEGKNILALAADELDRLLKALGEDEISLNFPIPCNEENVKELLALSTCRRCGRCCRPNPQNPASPGIEAFEDEIKAMAELLRWNYEDIKRKTNPGDMTSMAFQIKELGFTRWLPLPCPFFSQEQCRCQAYTPRPVVCQVYPIIFTGDDTIMSIRLTCEYGRDITAAACRRLREKDPDLEITL